MKKVITLLLVLAVALTCLPLGMVSYAATYTPPVFPGMEKLNTDGLKKFSKQPAGHNGKYKVDLVFDGDPGHLLGGSQDNFFENKYSGEGYAGIDLGEGNVQFVRKIRYVPRAGFAGRLNGAYFEGSNLAEYEGYERFTEPLSGHVGTDGKNTDPVVNGWFEINLEPHWNAYRYLRMTHPTTLNVTEIEYYMATGADYIASRAAYAISKDVRAHGNDAQAVVTLPALSEEEAANYNVSYEVMSGAAAYNSDAGTITYTPSATEDTNAEVKVTAAHKTDAADKKEYTVPVTIKRQAKNMEKPNFKAWEDTFAKQRGVNVNRADAILNGNLVDFFEDSDRSYDQFVGIDLTRTGNDKKFIRKIRYLPRIDFAQRLNGSVFEGSNAVSKSEEPKDARFYEEYAAIAEPLSGHIKSNETNRDSGPNAWVEIDLFDNVDAYKFVRLRRPLEFIKLPENGGDGGPLNVTEIELYMATGADHIASLAASRIGKVLPRPADGSGKTERTFAEVTEGTDGYTVTYTIADGSQGVSMDADKKITFTHDAEKDLKATINVTAVSEDGTDSRTITLPVTIKQNITESDKLDTDKNMVDAAFKAMAGASEHVVNGYMDLPTETKYGSAVTWAVTSGAESVLFANNRVSSKDTAKESKTITLTATVALNETTIDTLSYNVTVNSGLGIWYKFDAASVDESAKTVRNSGFNTEIGAATLERGATALQGAGAVYLQKTGNNRETQHVKMPPNIVADIDGDYTVSIMMYKDGNDGWPFYISSRGQNVGNPKVSPWFGILPNGRYLFDSKGNNQDKHEINPRSNYSGQWINITLSYSGQTMTMYADGVNKGTKDIPFKLSEKFSNQTEDAWNFLGACGWSGDKGYTGMITDFRIYSRALSADEAKSFATGKPNVTYADWKAVGQCKSALSLAKTENIIADITLPTSVEGTTVTWKSSDASVISDAGVIKPEAQGGETATLEATITKGDATTTKSFVITLGKGGTADTFAVSDKAWLEDTYDFNENTVNGEDYLIMTLPTTAPNESSITWTYDGKGVSDDDSALTVNTDGTVKLFAWKSAFEALNKKLTATITNNANGGPATRTFEKDVTAEQLANVMIPVSAEATSGTAAYSDRDGQCTSRSGRVYLKFDVSGVQGKITAANKKIVKAELQVRNAMGSEPNPIIVGEAANSNWRHGAHLGAVQSNGAAIPEGEQIAIPADGEIAFIGNSIKKREIGKYDITYAFLNGFGLDTSAYTLYLTTENTGGWADGFSGIASINKPDEPQNWARLVLTLADSTAEMSELYTEITKQAYSEAVAALAEQKLAIGVPTQLPVTETFEIDNPNYPGTEKDPQPEKISVTGRWYAVNAGVDRNNRMTITDKNNDVILALHLHNYVKCFETVLHHTNFVDYRYKKEITQNGITLTKADNAGEAFLYTAVYEGGKLISAERTDLSEVTWDNHVYTHAAPDLKAGQTVKYYLWNQNLVPYF